MRRVQLLGEGNCFSGVLMKFVSLGASGSKQMVTPVAPRASPARGKPLMTTAKPAPA
jgi:hypothetical protein